jgi:hypothetical protein
VLASLWVWTAGVGAVERADSRDHLALSSSRISLEAAFRVFLSPQPFSTTFPAPPLRLRPVFLTRSPPPFSTRPDPPPSTHSPVQAYVSKSRSPRPFAVPAVSRQRAQVRRLCHRFPRGPPSSPTNSLESHRLRRRGRHRRRCGRRRSSGVGV